MSLCVYTCVLAAVAAVALGAAVRPQCKLSRYPGKELFGFDKKVIDAESLEECAAQCERASVVHGFECRSGIFYSDPTPKLNCVLNDNDKSEAPLGEFIDTQDPVVPVEYFDWACGDDKASSNKHNKQSRKAGASMANLKAPELEECLEVVVPKWKLERIADKQVIVGSFGSCVTQCVKVGCAAGVFDAKKRMCALHMQTRAQQPEVFVESKEGVDYFEPGTCGQ